MPQVSLKYNICSSYNIYKDVTLQDKVRYLFFFSHTELVLVMDVASCLRHFLIKAAVTGFSVF